MFTRRMLQAMVGGIVALAASVAWAEPPKPTTNTVTTERGYGYEFSDDPVNAVQGGALGGGIIVLKAAVKGLLIRPRVQFIAEMLKSVENI